jgi:histidinol-phosphate phosphatase family protein
MNEKNKAVFLDMQGTLGGTGIDDISNFDFYPFAIEAIKELNRNGILAVLTTNQSNISRGYLSQKDFDHKILLLKRKLCENGAHFDGVYCCPHAKEDNCSCKKPLTGMVEEAVKEFNIDVENSFVVGDMGMSDIVLANNVGAKGILVLTGVGKGSLSEFRHTWQQYEADYIAENVLEAVKWILRTSNEKSI